MSANEVITEHLDLWTSAITQSTNGRGITRKVEMTGIDRLREFILELAIRGELLEQLEEDGHSSQLIKLMESKKNELVSSKTIKKPKSANTVAEEEQPFTIPNTWAWLPLGAVGHTQTGATPPKARPDLYGDHIPFLKPGNITEKGIVHYDNEALSQAGLDALGKWAEKDTILMVCIGTIGKCGITDRETTFNQQINSITPFVSDVSRFLLICLKSPYFQNLAWAKSSSTTITILNKGKWESIPVPLPPLEEQRRIVQKVDELMALCDRLEQQTSDQLEAHETLLDTLLNTLTQSENATELVDNWTRFADRFDILFTTEQSIDKLRQTILQLAVMGRLVEQDSGDELADIHLKKIKQKKEKLGLEQNQRKGKVLPVISEDERPFSLPDGWILTRLDEITDIQSGTAKGKKLTGKTTRVLPYLRVANVQRSALDLSEIKYLEIPEEEIPRYLVRPKDLLITEGGDWDKVGRTAIWDGSISPIIHQNHVFRARLILEEQNEQWLEMYLNSQFARLYFADSSKQTTNLASINKTQLRSCTIPLPPLAEQKRIVDKVTELMALCIQLKDRVGKASETQSLLANVIVEKGVSA